MNNNLRVIEVYNNNRSWTTTKNKTYRTGNEGPSGLGHRGLIFTKKEGVVLMSSCMEGETRPVQMRLGLSIL